MFQHDTRNAALTGWGTYLPERIVTNEIEATVDTTDDGSYVEPAFASGASPQLEKPHPVWRLRRQTRTRPGRFERC